MVTSGDEEQHDPEPGLSSLKCKQILLTASRHCLTRLAAGVVAAVIVIVAVAAVHASILRLLTGAAAVIVILAAAATAFVVRVVVHDSATLGCGMKSQI